MHCINPRLKADGVQSPVTASADCPEARLNADLKHVIRSNLPARSEANPRAATELWMAVIGSETEHVKACFTTPLSNMLLDTLLKSRINNRFPVIYDVWQACELI